MADVVTLDLPFPPSVNHYWRHVNGRVLVSRGGRQYREAVGLALLAAGRPHLAGRLSVRVVAYPPDRARRDLDNLMKSVLDSLQAAGLYDDDGQIDDLRVCRGDVCRPAGRLAVVAMTMEEAKCPKR